MTKLFVTIESDGTYKLKAERIRDKVLVGNKVRRGIKKGSLHVNAVELLNIVHPSRTLIEEMRGSTGKRGVT